MIKHGGDTYNAGPVLDFSASISPLGIPESVRHAMTEALEAADRYPDIYCRDLRQALSVYEGIPADRIVCGNGATELIYRIVGALKPKRAVLFAPAFTEYERALVQAGCDISYYHSGSLGLDEGFVDLIGPDVDIVFLCDPNNPTGFLIAPALLKRIISACSEHRTFLCVDECFLDFVTEGEKYSAKNMITDRMVCLKAFTKSFALAGVRLGYALCGSRETAERIFEAGYPWSVSAIAQAAGIAAAAEKDHIRILAELVKKERGFLQSRLESAGLKVYESAANFLLVRADTGLYERLRSGGILLRQCGDFRGLDDSFYRIAVRKHEDNVHLTSAI